MLFAGLYVWHALRVPRLLYVDRIDRGAILDISNLLRAVPAALQALARWSMEAMMPAALSFSSAPFVRLVKNFSPSWHEPLQVVNAVVVVALLLVLLSSMSARQLARVLPLLAVLTGAMLAYVAIICLGRSSHEAMSATYYLYVFCVLAMPIAYALIDSSRVGGWKKNAAAVSLAVFALLHASGTLAATREVARVNRDASRYLTGVARFVDGYRKEADFTFAIATPRPAVDPEVSLREGYPDEAGSPVHVRRVTEILFSRYYDADRPKYVLP